MSLLSLLPALILSVCLVPIQSSPVSGLGNGWVFSSVEASRGYLYTPHAMSWAEAEDFCQMVYGHLATDDSSEELRQYLHSANISGAVWIGLHQSKPQTQFTWTNDFDWSEVSMAPGDGWGEYVEEYEAALCVSLDIDHGFRWDTRYCQGVLVAGTVCQIQVPMWVRDGRCSPPEGIENLTLRYYPDQELVHWSSGPGEKKTKLCSIEDNDNLEPVLYECCNNFTQDKKIIDEHQTTDKHEEIENIVVKSDNIQSTNETDANNETVPHHDNLKIEHITNYKITEISKKENQTTKPKDAVSVIVKFEVKNNTKQVEKKVLTNGSLILTENYPVDKLRNNTETQVSNLAHMMQTSPSPYASTSNTSNSTSDTSSEAYSRASMTTTETVPSVPKIYTKYILNRTHQVPDDTTHKVSADTTQFSNLPLVTNLNLISSVTPTFANSTVEIPPKVSISTDIFNSSQESSFKEGNTTWTTLATEVVTPKDANNVEEEDRAPNTSTTVNKMSDSTNGNNVNISTTTNKMSTQIIENKVNTSTIRSKVNTSTTENTVKASTTENKVNAGEIVRRKKRHSWQGSSVTNTEKETSRTNRKILSQETMGEAFDRKGI